MSNNFQTRRNFRIAEVLHVIAGNYELLGNSEKFFFNNIADIETGDADSLVFITAGVDGVLSRLRETKSNIVVVEKTGEDLSEWSEKKILLVTDRPRTNFSKIANYVLNISNNNISQNRIHPTALIDPDAIIGKNVSIGPYSVIGKVIIGDGTQIGPYVHINDETVLGKNVVIQTGCVIGSVAYSEILNEPGSCRVSFPQLGGVVIEDFVSIGPMTCIQRGALKNTLIKQNSSIDTFVQIAHNVEVGQNVTIIGHSHVGGSVKLGDGVYIGQSSTIDNVGSIGSDAFLGIGSVVIRPVERNSKVFGNPATRITSPKITK